MEVIKAAEILIEKIKKDYSSDVAVVVMMGSRIYGETHSRSDLDLYFVPNTPRGFNLGFTFIIDEIGFDFWPISWNRLERIANHDEKITSIITEGKVLYYSSKEDLERFNSVKEKALDLSYDLTNRAQAELNKVYKDYFSLVNSESLSSSRLYALKIIDTITYALALLNRITVKRGRKRLKQEILEMPLVPKNFEVLYDTVFKSKDVLVIKQAYGQLIKNVEALINQEKNKMNEVISFKDNLTGFYEELINFYNKIYRSVEINDPVTPLFASVEITNEIDQAFENTLVSSKILPDLIEAYDPDNLSKIATVAKLHQEQFTKLLNSKGVIFKTFKDFDDLKQYVDSL